MNRKCLALVFIVASSLCVFSGILSTAGASTTPTKFRIVFDERTFVDIFSIEEVDINNDGFPDFLIIEGYEEWNFTGTVEGNLTLDILLVGKIANGPLFVSGTFEITINGDVIQGTFSIKQKGWDPSLSLSRGTFVGYGDMNVKGRISKAYGTDVMVWEGISW